MSLMPEAEPSLSGPPLLTENEITKTFLIGYELAIQPEDAHKVHVGDFIWLRNMLENGEAMVGTEEAKRFLEFSAGYFDYAVTMDDGSVKYLDIDIYRVDLIPNTPYVKAYWTEVVPEDENLNTLDSKANPSIERAVEFKSSWVPLEDSDEAAWINNLLKSSNTKYFEIMDEKEGQKTYHLRFIDSSQERVS